jgi:membrane dipeptidase
MKVSVYRCLWPGLLLSLCAFTPGSDSLEAKSAKYHQRALTIDSHTDTPMRLMRSDFDFGKFNDPWKTGTKLDLPRMEEGQLDAVFFAAFIGQGERSPEGNAAAYNEARDIIDTVYSLVERFPAKLGMAKNSL